MSKSIKYRLALILGSTGLWVSVVYKTADEGTLESKVNFLKWIGGWQEEKL